MQPAQFSDIPLAQRWEYWSHNVGSLSFLINIVGTNIRYNCKMFWKETKKNETQRFHSSIFSIKPNRMLALFAIMLIPHLLSECSMCRWTAHWYKYHHNEANNKNSTHVIVYFAITDYALFPHFNCSEMIIDIFTPSSFIFVTFWMSSHYKCHFLEVKTPVLSTIR